MEASGGVTVRSILCFRDAHDRGVVGLKNLRISMKPAKLGGQLIRCDGSLKKKEKKRDQDMVKMKKKLKFVKVLSRDLSMLSSWGFGIECDGGLIDEDKGKKISEAAELLLEQLKQLREEEKEMKKKRKEVKDRLKAADIGTAVKSTCSDCGESDLEMVNILKGLTVEETTVEEPQLTLPVDAIPQIGSTSFSTQEQKKLEGGKAVKDQIEINYEKGVNCSKDSDITSSIGGGGVVMGGALERRIEVCMGGKCKKAGAMALMEEFERRVGREGGVVGCKCMGKCGEGPNVRVLNRSDNMNASGAPTKSPLCIGVGLEDVSLIVASFFGEERKDLRLMAS